MKRNFKVLFLSSWFPNRLHPTNGDFVERHARAASRENNVMVLFVQADPEMKSRQREFHEKAGSPYELTIYFKKSRLPLLSMLINGSRYISAYLHGFRFVVKKFGKPDIIHASVIYPIIFVVALFRRFSPVPFVITEHWTIYLTDHIPRKRLTRWLARKAGMIMPVSNDLGSSLRRHGFRGNFKVVPNAVDLSRFVMKERTREKTFRFLHVSSMKEEQKNITGILRAAGELDKTGRLFRIDFVGQHSETQFALAGELGLLDRKVFFHGKQKHEDIPAFMQDSDAFLLFSNYENQPCVIAESFSCGLPVLSTDTGGIGEHVNERTGYLVNKGDESGLVHGMVYMMDHDPEYDRKFIHHYAAEHFSMERVGRQFAEVYQQVLQGRKAEKK